MITTLILGLIAVTGAVAIAKHWPEIIDWLTKYVKELLQIFLDVAQTIMHAGMALAKTLADGFTEIIHKEYYQEGEQWMEQVTRRKIDKSQMPPYIKQKLGLSEAGTEVNITSDIERELKLQNIG
ncbi:MAG: hypothetical protein J6M62_12170 [Selenomonadaceae bacterium]|nr:hypothetical protein [Selenomonadaceae bacterium]MBO6305811.1 hypothetical protein [Selenomonadaceae bacterium]